VEGVRNQGLLREVGLDVEGSDRRMIGFWIVKGVE
jgi:hypothetical protein